MKNSIKRLLIAVSILSSINFISAGNPKTFFMSRPKLNDLAMEYSLWHEHAYNPGKNNYNSHTQVTPFLQNSTNGNDIGKYFVFGDRDHFNIAPNNDSQDINSASLGIGSKAEGKVTLSPKQESYGVRLDFFQNLKFPIKKMYLKLSSPIFYVHNDLNATFEGTGKDQITKFFNGGFDGVSDGETKLTKAKMPTKAIDKTGVGDIDVVLGYKFIDSEKHLVFLNAGLTAPVGTKPRGEYLFEPVYGNGNHFAAGLGIDASLKLWENNKHAARILTVLNWRYLFEGHEERTIGLTIPGYKFAHYYKLFQDPSDNLNYSAANLLTQNISVRPGNTLEGLVNFAFTGSNFIVDLGYNIFCKQAESIIVSPDVLKIEFDDTNYNIVTKNKTNRLDGGIGQLPTELDLQTAATPSQLTHKVYAGLGYTFNINDKYPTSLGLGSSYEFADSNNELEGYAFWLKGVFSF